MTDENNGASEAPTDDGGAGEIAAGDTYRLTDDGTTFEVVGVTDDEVDVVQYADSGERQAEYTTTIEKFRSEIADLAE